MSTAPAHPRSCQRHSPHGPRPRFWTFCCGLLTICRAYLAHIPGFVECEPESAQKAGTMLTMVAVVFTTAWFAVCRVFIHKPAPRLRRQLSRWKEK